MSDALGVHIASSLHIVLTSSIEVILLLDMIHSVESCLIMLFQPSDASLYFLFTFPPSRPQSITHSVLLLPYYDLLSLFNYFMSLRNLIIKCTFDSFTVTVSNSDWISSNEQFGSLQLVGVHKYLIDLECQSKTNLSTQCIAPHYTSLYCLHFTRLIYSPTALHSTSTHCSTTALQYYTQRLHYTTTIHFTAVRYTALLHTIPHYTTLHFTTLQYTTLLTSAVVTTSTDPQKLVLKITSVSEHILF